MDKQSQPTDFARQPAGSNPQKDSRETSLPSRYKSDQQFLDSVEGEVCAPQKKTEKTLRDIEDQCAA